MNCRKIIKDFVLLPIITVMAMPPLAFAMNAAAGGKALSQAQLEQMLAPIALYPDSLLAQVLMASTYPVQVVEADRWVKKHRNLKGKALNSALDKMNWEPSVKALVPFPQVLSMMSDQLAWTENLGDAFIARQSLVMETVQKLRARAKAQNTLKSNRQQNVIVEQKVIKIEPADPQVVYVPAYNPVVVYGAWPYPAYPPYPYYPAGAVVAAGAVGFAAGVAVGAAWNNNWGHWNWGNNTLNVNVNKNININNTHVNNLNSANIQTERWQHNAAHGKGAAYGSQANRQGYSRKNSGAANGHNGYGGRTATHPSSAAKTPSRQTSRNAGPQSGAAHAGSGSRGSMGRAQNMPLAFQGLGHGNQVRRDSARGFSSRQSAMRSGGSFGGFSRGGFRRR
ncbi:MAG: DUF3300 domain-containing protein [Deltaproteobacteria bacterium]|jgi:hypothetical protein|nr:DUF3300 domain-containing protein [Deltaproteobacteria bacterium]